MTEIEDDSRLDEINEARDWQGQEVRCESCPHRELLANSKCRQRLACVADRYARRIDRFFDWNPELANSSLAHPYFRSARRGGKVRGCGAASRTAGRSR